jgi:hypothetical protein
VNGSQSKFLTEFGLYPKINPKPQHTKSAALKPVMLHLPCHGEILRVKKKSNREARTQPKASGENQLKTGGACYEEKNRTSDEPSQITKPAARLSKRSRSPRGTTQPHRIRGSENQTVGRSACLARNPRGKRKTSAQQRHRVTREIKQIKQPVVRLALRERDWPRTTLLPWQLSELKTKIETTVETGHDPSARCARRRGNRDEPRSPRRKTETKPRTGKRQLGRSQRRSYSTATARKSSSPRQRR